MPAQPKVTKRSSPHHSVPRLGSACPHSGTAIVVDGARRSKSKARSKTTPLLCRSRLASEKPENAALNQAANVIVNDLREQARSYKPLKPAGRPLCFAFDLDLRHTEPKRGAEWWGKSVLVTFARCSKVTRCKSGTHISPDQNNGYTHQPNSAPTRSAIVPDDSGKGDPSCELRFYCQPGSSAWAPKPPPWTSPPWTAAPGPNASAAPPCSTSPPAQKS